MSRILLAFTALFPLLGQACDERKFHELLESNPFHNGEAAFSEIRDCEDLSALSPETLNKGFKLLLSAVPIEGLSESEYARLEFEYLKALALTPSLYYIFMLEDVYTYGAADWGIMPNASVSRCFLRIMYQSPMRQDVEACLALAEVGEVGEVGEGQ